jgi:NAD-dependent dihydropyrimidine dehydrogenase PreA subunit
MKTALIYVFSGTGNTSLTAKLLCGHLEARGVKTTVYNVKSTGSPPPPGEYDYIGFGYPVYAYNLPEIFYRFAQSLPAGSNKAFIFKTSGEPFRLNRVSSCKLVKCLKAKGYDVVLEQHLLMPYNILFRYPDALAKQMYIYSDALCAMLAARLTAGERDVLKFNPLSRFASFLFRIQWPGARLNGRLYSANKSKCVKCMRCVRDCPTANISLKKCRIAFGPRCVMCMRCAMYCPADAINIGLLRPFKVHGAYDFDRVLDDPSIPADFIGPYTKGYFKLFRKFFSSADAMLLKYGISVCDSEYEAEYFDSDNTISQ